MTPQEKAQELLSKLFPYSDGWVNRRAVAIIMIDQLVISSNVPDYWEKVKQEIKAL